MHTHPHPTHPTGHAGHTVSACLHATPRGIIAALQRPELYRPAVDLQQTQFISLHLDLRPHASSVISVCSRDGNILERQGLHTLHLSPHRIEVAADASSPGDDIVTDFELHFILTPNQRVRSRRETRLAIATRYTPEPWWPPTIPDELAALTALWLHRLDRQLTADTPTDGARR